MITFSLCLFIAELSKHKRYEIRMSVYNAVGEGPTSPPQEVFVGEAGVCAPPLTSIAAAAHYNLCVLLHKLVFI